MLYASLDNLQARWLLAVKLVQNGTLKIYPGSSHGMAILNAETINPDLLAFIGS
jgi:non-heme chloroperoxidase